MKPISEGDEFARIETRVVNFRQIVAPATGVILVAPSPLNGRITSVTMHFPPGSNALVLVAFRKGTKPIVPVQGFVALNDATPTYPTDEPVSSSDDLYVEIQNTDAVFDHTITVNVAIVGTFKPLKV